jgi:hypothetical protein
MTMQESLERGLADSAAGRVRPATAREEILIALTSHGWKTLREDQPTLIAGWRNLRVVLQFDTRDSLKGAAIKRYQPFNQGPVTEPVTKDRRNTVLQFIRGESQQVR